MTLLQHAITFSLRMMGITNMLWIAAALFIATAGQAEGWPEFRGPTGQGHSKARNLPLEWAYDPETSSKNIVWVQAIPGKGWSSPVVANGQIYLTTAAENPSSSQLSLRALSLGLDSGKILWNVELFSAANSAALRIHSKNSNASPTPLLEGNRLYAHFGHYGTACLDLSGKVLWRNTDLNYEPVHGNGGSPVIVDDALIFSCDGASDPFVVALNKRTGQVIWKVPRPSNATKTFSFCTPLLITVNGQNQVISPGSNVVCAYDPKTGREIWRVRYQGYSVVPRPVYGHELVFISTGFDRPTVMAIRPDGAGDVTDTHVAWSFSRGAPNTPSMLLVANEIYMVSDGGIAGCLDAKTGRVHWQERIGGNYSASPVYADERIYFQNEEGTGVVINPGKQFHLLARNPLGERTIASYAVTDGALIIRGEQHLFRIGAGANEKRVTRLFGWTPVR